MKKSVLAVAIAAAAFAASAASAAQVYDKDGTTLAVGGQIEFMVGNAGNSYFGNSAQDTTTRDRARLTMAGRTQLTSGIAAYAYNEWQADHSGNSVEGAALKARQQFFGVYGGQDERNSGHLSYMWKGFGFDAGVSYQFAEDKYNTDLQAFDVNSGFSIYAGYTSPVVVFGPISVRAAYLYLEGQDQADGAVVGNVDDMKVMDGSLAWGTNGKGFYIATNYNYTKVNYIDSDDELKVKAWESVATYGFTNGIRLGASYHYINAEDDTSDDDRKYVQLIADYNVTPNFKVWAEGLIDAGSDDGFGRITSKYDKDAHNSVMFGARYVF